MIAIIIIIVVTLIVMYFYFYRRNVEKMTDYTELNNTIIDGGDYTPNLINQEEENSNSNYNYNEKYNDVLPLTVEDLPLNQTTEYISNENESIEIDPMKVVNSINTFPNNQLNPSELLPKDTNSIYAQMNPSQGDLNSKNFLEAGYHMGINTSGQSNPIPNRQLRSDPIIPPRNVSPWSQSTKQPDTTRRFFEIGSA